MNMGGAVAARARTRKDLFQDLRCGGGGRASTKGRRGGGRGVDSGEIRHVESDLRHRKAGLSVGIGLR
jgi:hypothetical protein